MKIEKVYIKEYKVLKDVDANLAGKNVLLIADNDRGKSTFINFIQTALGKQDNIPPGAVGDGYVIADKEGKKYTFKVKIKDGKSSVIIETEDGLSDSRRGTLAGIVGAINLDIDEFVKLSESKAGQKKQVEIFKGLLPEEIRQRIADFENNVSVKYQERTELNRDIEKLKGAIAKHPLDNLRDSDLKAIQPVDLTKVYDELKAATTHNENVERGKLKQAEIEKNILREEQEIERLLREIEEKKKIIAEHTAQKDKIVDWLFKNEKKDITELEKKISFANETNVKHQHAQELLKQRIQLKTFIEESGEMTALIESQREGIQRTIREMDSPVEDLTFDEEKLLYKGFPVHPSSLSTSAIMELGIKMKMAENPDLGILFVERSESLGAEKWKQLLEISENYGWQIIAEKVERGKDKLQIEIING